VARCRLAAKLHPDTAWGQLHLVGALIGAKELNEAGKTLKLAEQLEPGRWDSHAYRGLLAVASGGLEPAVADLRKSLELNPKYGRTHFVLAWVLARQGKLEEARDEYRLALLYGSLLSTEDKVAALRAIADLNEKLAAK
jgi:Flp pilus assembly protein TadD